MPAAGDIQPLKPARKQRYVPSPGDNAAVLTPKGLEVLASVGQFGIVTARQAAELTGRSPQVVRRDLRRLFDRQLLRIAAAPRISLLTDPGDTLTAVYGSAPNLYQLTPKGERLLRELLPTAPVLSCPAYGAENWLMLRHALGARDVAIFFLRAARMHRGHRVEALRLDADAAFDLERSEPPREVRPDVWLVYRFEERVLLALIEYDTGSERGRQSRWHGKLAAYRWLLSSPVLARVTGHAYGRVLVVCTRASRRDHLTDLIARHADPALAERFWLAALEDLAEPDLSRPVWRRPGRSEFLPLIPAALLSAAPDQLADERLP